MKGNKFNIMSKLNNINIFNKYIMILILILFLLTTGITYAYYAFRIEEESVIVGNAVAINVELKVDLIEGTNTKMVPLLNDYLDEAIKGEGSPNGACIDKYNNLSCQVYKITLTNKGARLKHLNGTVELYAKEGEGNVYNNLKWRELTNPTTIKTNSIINGMDKAVLVSDLTIESKEEKVWYIAVWISETITDQRETDKGFFAGTVTFGNEDVSIVNEPNLDNDNLIPVYFDENAGTKGAWKKADSSNANKSWYDYEDKMWANAIITSNNTYKTASVGTTITDSDIIAFYVWIPRYKYRVWNITRQGGNESTYAYPAYSKGIDIEFEHGIASTGNVECTYDVTTQESDTNLSDVCVYNGTDTITTTSGNTNYTNAWYTHPAFTFGDKEIEGFWIGKFETSGSATSPKILPDVQSLREQKVSAQFTTSKKFQNYLSSNIDAHMLTNLEWGAVAYLSHSIYGLCNGSSCDGVYINNSSGYYTGRSGGAIAGSTDLDLKNVYPGSSTSTDKYNSAGYYDYKGYFINYGGTVTTTKDITKVASTTRNITGVYDMSGGAYDYVMGNIVDSSYNFYPFSAGTNWDGSTTLDIKYYNAYSYGINSGNSISHNKARLGDATAEVLGSATSETGAWKVGSAIIGTNSHFIFNDGEWGWFSRGGRSSSSGTSSFYFDRSNGGSGTNISFRSSLS